MRSIITWMHPSYRDLVIDELATQDALRIKFLKEMGLPGIKLAISDAGGAEGTRRFPLMTDSKSWGLLRIRAVEIVNALQCNQETDLLMALTSATQKAVRSQEVGPLVATLAAVCDALRAKWNSSSAVLGSRTLETYCHASLQITPLPPMPQLGETWTESYGVFRETIDDAQNGSILDESVVKSWADLADVIHNNEPRFLKQVRFPEKYSDEVSQLVEIIRGEMDLDIDSLNLDAVMSEIDKFETLEESTEILGHLVMGHQESLKALCASLASFVSRLERKASDLETPDSGEDDDNYGGQTDEFDIDALFSDL